jgi:pyruvate formate lyase activating enzyme
MEISGFVKSSLIDYPQKVAAVVFTQGCNFKCGFCHNPKLIVSKEGTVAEKEVIDLLTIRQGKLDGVVITGGEPTVQKDLIRFIKEVKSMGYLVKLDTNGTDPKILKKLIDDKLVDYVAMDIKGPPDSYIEITGFMNTKVIQTSIDILKESDVDYEFRTTVLPFYHGIKDFGIVGEMLRGATLYTIQGFRPEITFDKKLESEPPFKQIELEKIARIMKKYVKNVNIHANL